MRGRLVGTAFPILQRGTVHSASVRGRPRCVTTPRAGRSLGSAQERKCDLITGGVEALSAMITALALPEEPHHLGFECPRALPAGSTAIEEQTDDFPT